MQQFKHVHHIVPKHAGGTNDEHNLIELTVEEHAEAHKALYEKYNRKEDYLAWKCLAGQISKEDIQREKSILGGLMTPVKRVAKYDKSGNLLETYTSLKDASLGDKTLYASISACANLRLPIARGHLYRFYEDVPIAKIESYIHGSAKCVEMLDSSNNIIRTFLSVKEAKFITKINNIHLAAKQKIKHAGGYKWRYCSANV